MLLTYWVWFGLVWKLKVFMVYRYALTPTFYTRPFPVFLSFFLLLILFSSALSLRQMGSQILINAKLDVKYGTIWCQPIFFTVQKRRKKRRKKPHFFYSPNNTKFDILILVVVVFYINYLHGVEEWMVGGEVISDNEIIKYFIINSIKYWHFTNKVGVPNTL